MIDPHLLEISDYTGEGYQPLIVYGAWRVAIPRYIDELLPQNIGKMQRHDNTHEVFVLLSGRCILFVGAGTDRVEEILVNPTDTTSPALKMNSRSRRV
jgi:hypothetical protein